MIEKNILLTTKCSAHKKDSSKYQVNIALQIQSCKAYKANVFPLQKTTASTMKIYKAKLHMEKNELDGVRKESTRNYKGWSILKTKNMKETIAEWMMRC